MIRTAGLGLVAAVGVAAAGCAAVGPDYAPPEPAVPSVWHAELAPGVSTAVEEPEALGRWWATLDDPVLTRLVERAVAGNLELKRAQARVREARARRRQVAADYLPSLDASASVNRQRSSEETGAGGASGPGFAIGPDTTRTLYSTGFDASWELDLFGGSRRAVEAATASLQASQEDLRHTLVSLLSEVGQNYVDVRTTQARIAIAERNLDVQRETYEIARFRFEAGLVTQLDVEQARYNLEQTSAAIPALRIQLAEARHRLAVLLGDQPGSLDAELAAAAAVPDVPAGVAIGVPAGVLRRRPDVRRAERELAAQTARVGVATAELYPAFSLIGSIGLEALSLSNLFTASARTAALGATGLWTVFDAGRLRANVRIESALQEQALLAYESAVRTALEETENALVAFAEEQARRSALRAGTAAAERAATLARQQYESGLLDFQQVLDAQRTLLSLQDQLAASEGAVVSNLIALYKALGGGWTPGAAGSDGTP
ncbi:MAG TPA: efflux transporter outer membrane subunit [Thermodesulfobacteriota bacterium]